MPKASRPFATSLIIFAVAFNLGVIYGNWPYDYHTLWLSNPTKEAFQNSLNHYRTWAEMPLFLAHVHHVVMLIGILGITLKLYKPTESNKLFDGGSTFLYVVAICIYISNLKQGTNAILYDAWGEIDEHTGLNVMAASQVMICFTLLGVLILQLGQYYADYEDQKIIKKAREEESAAAAAAAAAATTTAIDPAAANEADTASETGSNSKAQKRTSQKKKRKNI